MDQYKFNAERNKMIVNAIVDGYRDYIEHRKDRKVKMKISSAFSWTKGNFIESKIAEECMAHGFTYKKAKAGLTWDYLQFIHEDSKLVFLIKNAAYFNEDCFSQAKLPNHSEKHGPRRTYLHELSKINGDLTFSPSQRSSRIRKESERVEQLALWVSNDQVRMDLETFKSSYTQFHILTYSLDDAYQVSEIMHYLPNPHDNIAYLVDDLSDFILGAELTDEERELIAPEMNEDIMDPAAFDIGIFEDEQHIHK
ncbi:hypothetical protein [Paenibacillus assamensis]|uniref:spr1630 family ClpXP-sensitive toxin n=1 Tax=Paenibacillus assamensis TaxID=311244 RepID=UPI0003FD9EA9|nr:hypothetical protein [Paenibacillus assamensis]